MATVTNRSMEENAFFKENRVALPTGVTVFKRDNVQSLTDVSLDALHDDAIGKPENRKPWHNVGTTANSVVSS